jgi:aminobenzoyl-glutamate utilization protein B
MRARATLTLVALLLAWDGARASAQPLGDTLARIDSSAAQQFGPIAQRIWELAEVAYQERESVALLKEELRAVGFEIDDGVAGIPTAFVATWGRGRPAIGIIAEYDALPGLSQEAVPRKKPRAAGAAGHGCGHNLLGTASVMAALAVKDGLLARQVQGTIRVYGAPAGEAGGAKVFMLRSGLFTDLDAVLTWHPGDRNQALNASSLALVEGRLLFRRQAAQAGGSSEAKSPIDALKQAGQALEQLRGQLPQETRLDHHVVTSGGAAPVAGDDVAELNLLVRHPEQAVLDGLWERALESARAVVRATGATLEERVVGACANVLPNEPLAKLIDQNLRRAGGIQYSAEEKAFAEALRRTASLEGAPPLGSQEAIQPPATGYVASSTEVGDVSWVVPTGQLTTATYVPGTPGRSWQSTACAGSGIGRKGMVVAAKALALTALDLLTDSQQLAAARAAFQAGKAGAEYRSRLPLDAQPALAETPTDGAAQP